LIFGAALAASKSISFFLLPIYTHLMGVEQFGLLNLVLSFLQVVYLVAMFGMDSGFALTLTEANSSSARTVTGSALFLQVTWVIALIALSWPLGPFISKLLPGSAEPEHLIHLAFLLSSAQVIASFASTVAMWNRETWRYLPITLISAIASGGGSLAMLLWVRSDAVGAITGLLIGTAIAIPIGLLIVAERCHGTPSLSAMKRIISHGFPFFVSQTSDHIFPFTLRLVLLQFSGLGGVGVFGAVNTICLAISMLNDAFSVAWAPFAISQEGRAKGAEWANLLRFYAVVVAMVGALLMVAAPMLTLFVLGENQVLASAVLCVLALAYWIRAIRQQTCVALIASGRTWMRSALSWLAVLTSLTVALIIVKTAGILGGAWSMVAGETAAFLSGLVLLRRQDRSLFDWPAMLVTGASLSVFLLVRLYALSLTLWTSSAVAIGGLFCLIFVWLYLRVLRTSDIPVMTTETRSRTP